MEWSLHGTFLSRADVKRMRKIWLSSPAQGGDIHEIKWHLLIVCCSPLSRTPSRATRSSQTHHKHISQVLPHDGRDSQGENPDGGGGAYAARNHSYGKTQDR